MASRGNRGGRGGRAPRGGAPSRGGRGGRGGRAGRTGTKSTKAHLYRDHGYAFYGKFIKNANLQPSSSTHLTIPVDEATKEFVRTLQAEAQKRLRILSDLRGHDPVNVDDKYGVYLLGFDDQVKGFGPSGQQLAGIANKLFQESFGGQEASFEYGHLGCFNDLKNNTLLLLEIKPNPQIEAFLNSFYEQFLNAQEIKFPSAYTHTSLEIIDRPETRTSLITKRLYLPVFSIQMNVEREGFVIKAVKGMKLGTPGTGKFLGNIF